LRNEPRIHGPFFVDRKCPRIYYSDFNYRNRVGIKGVYKGCVFVRGRNFLQKKHAVIFLQHLPNPKVILQASIVPFLLQALLLLLLLRLQFILFFHIATIPSLQSAKKVKNLHGKANDAEMATFK
jgi:hypothetical protein